MYKIGVVVFFTLAKNYQRSNKFVQFMPRMVFSLYAFDQLSLETWGVAGLYGMENYIPVTGYNLTITASRANFGG